MWVTTWLGALVANAATDGTRPTVEEHRQVFVTLHAGIAWAGGQGIRPLAGVQVGKTWQQGRFAGPAYGPVVELRVGGAQAVAIGAGIRAGIVSANAFVDCEGYQPAFQVDVDLSVWAGNADPLRVGSSVVLRGAAYMHSQVGVSAAPRFSAHGASGFSRPFGEFSVGAAIPTLEVCVI